MDLTLILTIVFGLAAIVLGVVALRALERKKPVFAYETKKVVGLGTDAPAGLKLMYGDKQVPEVYRTYLVFFNRGKRAIQRTDVTKAISVIFHGAEVLDVARFEVSKMENDFRVQVNVSQRDRIGLNFAWLDHDDGAVMEVLHTKCKAPHAKSCEIECAGYVLEAGEPRYMGRFAAHRPKRFALRLTITAAFLLLPTVLLTILLFGSFASSPPSGFPVFGKVVLGVTMVAFWWQVISTSSPLFRHLKFPKWSILED